MRSICSIAAGASSAQKETEDKTPPPRTFNLKTNLVTVYTAERKLLAGNLIFVASYTWIVDHIDHIKRVACNDYVSIGSDFDGVPFLPAGMNGAEALVLMTYEMLKRGYTEAEIRNVLGENLLRAMSHTESVAKVGTRKISGEGRLKRIK